MSFQMDLEVSAPYPGLRPFRREEAQVFFGRDAQIDEILGRLKTNQFLGVVGSSGVRQVISDSSWNFAGSGIRLDG